MVGVVFPDPMLATVTYLRPVLAARIEAVAEGVSVGTLEAAPDGSLPYVSVRLEGSSMTLRVAETVTLRVRVWHTSEARALALAQLCRALLLTFAGSSGVRGYSPLVGPVSVSDPDNGTPLASFTVAARLRPTSI